MLDHAAMLGAICGPDGRPALPVLLGSLALAGLMGSAAHCVPMCGPFVLAQVSRNWARLRPNQLCQRQRVRQGLLLPYHAGRLTTYALLGAVAAGSSGWLGQIAGLGLLPGLLLLLGAVLLCGQALARLAPGVKARLPGLPIDIGARVARLAGRIDRDSVGGAYLFGMVLGCLPCGMLYAVLAVAASADHVLDGAAAMFAFGLGTVPSLMALGVLGQLVGRRWQGVVQSAAPALLLLNAMVLGVMAWQRLSVLV